MSRQLSVCADCGVRGLRLRVRLARNHQGNSQVRKVYALNAWQQSVCSICLYSTFVIPQLLRLGMEP